MKPTQVITLSFIPLFAFLTKLPLAFSNDVDLVLDTKGEQIFPGGKYYLMPSIFGAAGGGVKLGESENSKCPATVLQDKSEVNRGFPVRFRIQGISPGIITTATPLDIEFIDKPGCAETSKWSVFADNEIGNSENAYVGIGGAEVHPGKQKINGIFNIKKQGFGYKLVFSIPGFPNGSDIGRFDANNGENGRRLVITNNEPYEFVIVPASTFDANNIKSVV